MKSATIKTVVTVAVPTALIGPYLTVGGVSYWTVSGHHGSRASGTLQGIFCCSGSGTLQQRWERGYKSYAWYQAYQRESQYNLRGKRWSYYNYEVCVYTSETNNVWDHIKSLLVEYLYILERNHDSQAVPRLRSHPHHTALCRLDRCTLHRTELFSWPSFAFLACTFSV